LNKDIAIFNVGLQGVFFSDLFIIFFFFFVYDSLNEFDWLYLFVSLYIDDADIVFTDFFYPFLSFVDSIFFEMI
jgi:hypothetical protein